MSEITELLAEARGGDPTKLGAVFQAIYPELRRVAAARAAAQPPGSTLTTTALVHETYLKLVRSKKLEARDRRHFFACAAKAMREIVVDHLRARSAVKRGGAQDPITLPTQIGEEGLSTDLLDLDQALDDLDAVEPELRELVELRYFAGHTREEVAELLERSVRSVQRDWNRARAFLYARLAETQA